jgi:hypothetical protein
MAQGSSNLNLNLTKIANTNVSTSVGNTDAGTQRVVIASDQPSIFVNSVPAAYGLENVTITGTSGQFSCTEKDTTPLSVGQQVTVSGTLSGSGSITGYTSPKAYIVSQTNGSTTFTLVTLTGAAITTSTGTTTGLTFFMRGLEDVNIIGNARERFISIDNKLSNGTQKAILRSGEKGSTAASDVTSTAIDTNTQALDVVLKGSSTNTIGKLAANDGVDIGDVTINNTSIAVTDNGGSLTVDGTVGISGTVDVTGTFWQATQPVSISSAVPVTDNSGSLTVDGSVSVSNFPATQVVSGTVGISGTVPISGALTDTQLRASPVPVSGTFWQTTQPVTGTVTVAQATAANLNATVVGTVAISNFPATQAVTVSTLPSLAAGTNNIGDVDVASLPGTVAADITAIKTATELLDNALGTDGGAVGLAMLRVGGTDGTNNQTISVNTSGHINIADGGNSITVDGIFWQATQPVSGTVAISGTVPISGALTDTQLRATAVPVSLASVPSHPVTNAGTFAVQATQSGTWNIGSITTLPALAAGTNNIGAVSFSPNALVANAPTNASTTAYAASLIVKASAGVLYIVTGFNSRSSGQFIQIFDSATLPADTSVPKVIFYVESNSNFSFDLGVYGRAFSSGIVVCNSSTGPTKKIGAADCWFDVQYK